MSKKRYVEGMPINRFIEVFFETRHDCRKLKHQGLKSFNNPYIIGVSNDIALKNPDFVARSEIIVVIDDYGNMGSYLNPDHIKKLTELESCKYQLKEIEKITLHNFSNVKDVYEKFNALANRIRILEGIYGGVYDLLRYTERLKVLRIIKQHAKLEAKKELGITLIPKTTQKIVEDTLPNYDEELITYEIEILTEDETETYQVTNKINRQKKIDNARFKY